VKLICTLLAYRGLAIRMWVCLFGREIAIAAINGASDPRRSVMWFMRCLKCAEADAKVNAGDGKVPFFAGPLAPSFVHNLGVVGCLRCWPKLWLVHPDSITATLPAMQSRSITNALNSCRRTRCVTVHS